MSDEIIVDEQAQESSAPAWETKAERLLNYLEPFYQYVSGEMPKELQPYAKQFALSYSSISKLVDNPFRFYEYVVNTKFIGAYEPTKAMLVGSVADDYILSFLQDGSRSYVNLKNEYKRNTKAGKEGYANEIAELQKSYPDATIVDKQTWDKAQEVVEALVGIYDYKGVKHYRNKRAYDLLSTHCRQTKWRFKYTCPTFSLPIVGEIDLFGQLPDGSWYAADLKSMNEVDNKSFYYNVRDRLLSLQAHIYKTALKACKGIEISHYFIIAGCADKHSNIYEFSTRDMQKGASDYNEGLTTFADCLLNGAPAFIQSYNINDFEL